MTVTARPKAPPVGRQQSSRGAKADGTPTAADLAGRSEVMQRERADRITAVTEVIGITQIPLAALATAEQRRLGPGEVGAFTLDIVTIDAHKPALAGAIVDLAESYPVLGSVLDRLAKATPFGALLTVAISLGAQLAENHRALPTHLRGMSPNLVARDEFAENLRAQATQTNGSETSRWADDASAGRRRVRDNPQA